MEITMESIDRIEYGRMLATVSALEKKIDKMETTLDELLALANKGRGGFWAGMMIASLIGAVVSYFSKAILGQ